MHINIFYKYMIKRQHNKNSGNQLHLELIIMKLQLSNKNMESYSSFLGIREMIQAKNEVALFHLLEWN